MKVGGQFFDSEPIIIAQAPVLNVGYDCEDEVMLNWGTIPGGTLYNVYQMGDKYMEKMVVTSDTAIFLSKPLANNYYAIAAVTAFGEGPRSLTYDYREQGSKCYYRNLQAVIKESGIDLLLNLSTFYNINKIVFEKKINGVFEPVGVVNVGKDYSYHYFDPLSDGGVYTYRAVIVLANGEEVTTDEVVAYFANETSYFVFPNPIRSTQEELQVLSDANDLVMTLFDEQGRKVLTQQLFSTLFRFPITELTPGLYLYQIHRRGKAVSAGRLAVSY
jgi:hypothetical protein